jgi:ceramide glucosyltransferase
MMESITQTVHWAGVVLALASLGYLVTALLALPPFRALLNAPAPAPATLPPITILKPLYGLDEGLYENLRSFCEQDYPTYQVVFAVASAADPALRVLYRLKAALPGRDLAIVVDFTQHGSNRKISNLANAFTAARHGLLVMADSDMRVGPDYLRRIAAAFADPTVGAATCLYKGTPVGGLASRLACLAVNDGFVPSVCVALRLQSLDFCFGATMAIRREVLAQIGGFAAIVDHLADDYRLGKLVAATGQRVALVHYVPENIIHESGLASLWHHELRWARTIRGVRPGGYAFSFLTYPVPCALLALLLWPAPLPACLLLAALVLRTRLHYHMHSTLALTAPPSPWLLPGRDLLSFAVWAASFADRQVRWKSGTYAVDAQGRMSGERMSGASEEEGLAPALHPTPANDDHGDGSGSGQDRSPP